MYHKDTVSKLQILIYFIADSKLVSFLIIEKLSLSQIGGIKPGFLRNKYKMN